LESLRGDLPQQVSRLKGDIDEAENEFEDKKNKLQAYQKEKGITEMEIKALAGKKQKYQDQLFQVKNNREYDAVTHELENVKLTTEQKETRILEIMDLEKEIEEYLESAEGKIAELKENLKARTVELDKRLAETEKEEAMLNHEREKISRRLDPRNLAMYERISKAKKGSAVVSVIRNSCSGCFTSLPPQRVLEIRDMNRLFVCEVCGRILVWDEASENAV
jgi:predicted  nucleic acid-binding Zn-ribbon protein